MPALVRLAGSALSLCAAPAVATAAVSIGHEPLACVPAGAFPRVVARLAPVEEVSLGRVYFRASHDSGWYSVLLKPDGQGHSALLPRPKWLGRFTYRIEVSGTGAGATRTEEFTTVVEKDPRACGTRHGDSVAVARGILVDRPAGTAPTARRVPRGFSERGVVGGEIGMFELPPGRSALITAGLLGGALVGIQSQLQGETAPGPPPPPPYEIRFLGSSPPPGGTVSLSGTMSMRFGIAPTGSRTDVRFVRVDFIVQPFTCAWLFGPVPGQLPQEVQVENRMERATAARECQPPFATTRVQATVLGEGYARIPGAASVTLGVNYTIDP